MDDETKRIACRMIAGLVATDEDFSESERQFLDRVLQAFGVPEDEWDAIFPLLEHDEAERAIRSLEPSAQMKTFELLLQAALIDGTIAEQERAYLEAVGKAIGFHEAELAQRIPD